MKIDFFKYMATAISITDHNNIIIYMNNAAKEIFADYGGESLIGKNLLEFHNPNSQKIIKDILETGKPNYYTIEKNGKKKFISQMAWYNEEKQVGLVEISSEIPNELPHFVRE